MPTVCAFGWLGGGYVCFKIASIIMNADKPPIDITEESDFGYIPNIWLCPWSDDVDVKFAYGASWHEPGGLIYKDESRPEGEDSIVSFEVQTNGVRNAEDTTYSQYGNTCCFVDCSKLRPRFDGRNQKRA